MADGPDDRTGGPRFAAFCERFAVHTKGRWAGRALVLEPWQREFAWEALEVDPATGLRVYQEVGLGLPRKNGKSLIASAFGHYFLVADGEAEPEVYVAAAARGQAAIVLGQARRIGLLSPLLRRHLRIQTHLIECPRTCPSGSPRCAPARPSRPTGPPGWSPARAGPTAPR